MSWSHEEVICLIEEYRKWPNFYKVKSVNYKNRNLRKTALESMENSLKKSKPNITSTEIQNKFQSLKQNALKKYKKWKNSYKSGAGEDESTLRGKHLHTQAREMAFNVYQWIKSQNEDQCTKEIKEEVSRATAVSEAMSYQLTHTPSEQHTLNSRGYKLLRKLGEGSYAKVYLAEFTMSDSVHMGERPSKYSTQLACKIIDTTKAPSDFVKKFLPRELEILVKLNHPHIIHVHSIFQRKAKYFIFMRFAEHGDLLEFILKKGSVSEAQARVWVRQLALALQYLHNMEIAHRDLKCENALITNNYNVKLADFGFARFTVDRLGKRVPSETYCGSLSYAAPEILRGISYHPKISDLWSLGVIVYIMLNKAMPFDDTNIKKLYEQQSNKRWHFRPKVVDLVSEQLKKLTAHLLEPDTSKRWKVEQVLSSDWLAMDPRLMKLIAAEQTTIQQAQEERKLNSEVTKVLMSKKKKDSIDEITILKESRIPDDRGKTPFSIPAFVEE
ncbi:hypothetical protein FQA39_LY12178 [Lamprigera yunnana]|nr:hypothetical protein FQA39_LY12178 [Lamprigera yunnana]